jgi:small conductance mechanosensitive channel
LAVAWRANGNVKRADTLAGVLYSLSKYALGFVGICAILGVFNVPVASILAVAGIGSVAIGFGAQSLVKDFITGFFLLFEGQFSVGDIVAIGGKSGMVEAIGMRTTRIRSFDGDAHIIPNSQILLVTNMSGSFRHAVVDAQMPYEEHTFRRLCAEMRVVEERLPTLISAPSVLVIGGPDDGQIRIIAECQTGENAAVEEEIRRIVETFSGSNS